MTTATGNVIGQGIGMIGRGIAGAFPTTTTTNTNSNTDSTGEANANHNDFSNQDLITWLGQLMSNYHDQNTSNTTTPNLSPETQALIAKLTASYGGLTKPVDLSGYEAGQVQNINNNSGLAKQSADAIMASRGLATSPVSGTTDANIDQKRFSDISQLHQQIPMLQNQLNLQNLGAAANFMNLIPHGTTTVGSNNETGGSSTNTQGQQTGSSTSGGTAYQSTAGSTKSSSLSTQKSGGGLGGFMAGLFG